MQTNDYYKILQVHYQAEQEIIESAYKRLARKYHPDVDLNHDNGDRMQLINEAYAVLSDPSKRNEYNLIWESRNIRPAMETVNNHREYTDTPKRSDMRFLSAKALLEEYFQNITINNYSRCYELISELDKKNISKADFINWQTAVSRVYTMKEYKCDIYGVYRDKMIYGQMVDDVLEFSVNTIEYNIVMDMLQKDSFNKLIILENGRWKVFIGYEKLEPIINKFNDLKGLLNAKSVINELMENHSKIDNTTGLINQRGLLESIEREIFRFDRYGNQFSLILCEIEFVKLMNSQEEKEIINHTIAAVGDLLINNLRKLDLVGRWDSKRLMLLLPETGLMPAIKVTNKIQRLLKDNCNLLGARPYKLIMNFGVTEYYSSIEETLDRIYNQLI
ncbi:MAG: hypothetical protein H6Q59_2977 [Firmicutes bacterium]|nr:hypothetical protein [Bacillota bacterium]